MINIKNILNKMQGVSLQTKEDKVDILDDMLKLLMRGKITCAITGQFGSEKIDFLSHIVRYIKPTIPIRTLGREYYVYVLRELYPTRNIAVAKEPFINASESYVLLVDEVKDYTKSMLQTTADFTVFCSLMNTTEDLTRNLIEASGSKKEVAEFVNVDINLAPNCGERSIKRITEIIPSGESYVAKDILVYDQEKKSYGIAEWFSEDLTKKILKNVSPAYKKPFADAVNEYYSIKLDVEAL